MREPNCTRIVPSKNLWELAIDFMSNVDEKLMEFNLKYAYITYSISKIKRLKKRIISDLVFLSCFNDVGRLYEGEKVASSKIETYLFLKYFSPIKAYDAIIYETKNKMSLTYEVGNMLKMCMKFTDYILKFNNIEEAYKEIEKEKKNYSFFDFMALTKLVNKTDIIYEINSMHYKTIVYKHISRSLFSSIEKNKFFAMLSSLFEMYSPQTLYHSKTTAIISYTLARKMKIKKSRCKKIYVAGLCHDLGKVSIPLKILEKPDKLTDREYSIMKKHVEYTKDILKHKMDYDIIEIAYRHHEKLDGSGYPNKITASSLTVDQKILQVADIISALLVKRSYKEAWNVDKTISILNEMKEENKLDRDVIDTFIKYQDKIIKTNNKLMAQADKLYEKINVEREELEALYNELEEEKNPKPVENKTEQKKEANKPSK